MEKIVAILKELMPGVDVTTCTTLVDDHYLDSLAIVALISELEDQFDIEIPAVDIVADNFNSAENIQVLVTRLIED
ncbi:MULTISPECIES: acyl carrier protein [Atopobiaceae]|uniref:acyl carrier protein n=1 Tax=Atopobiaceae TaxID=1643824 RepID=UPI00034E4052|nr:MULTISPECIES: acyl carrier protein [Atopobiaceae]EPD78050.1 acyl carrier protein [Atopobium sp. oral taxon 199 str. F0494]